MNGLAKANSKRSFELLDVSTRSQLQAVYCDASRCHDSPVSPLDLAKTISEHWLKHCA